MQALNDEDPEDCIELCVFLGQTLVSKMRCGVQGLEAQTEIGKF